MKISTTMNSALLLIISIALALISSSTAKCVPRRALTLDTDNIILPPSPSPSPSTESPFPSPVLIPKPTTTITGAATSASSSMSTNTLSITDKITSAVNSLQDISLDGSYKALCDKTDFPDDCLSSMKSVSPLSFSLSSSLDLTSVLKLLIQSARHATQDALTTSQHMASQPGHDSITSSVIDSCTGGFEDALQDLDEAKKSLDGNDKSTCMINLSSVLDDYESCSDAFTDNAQPVHPMQNFEDLLHKHASNCLAIGSLIN